ncbi:quinoprotein relay system zinc metallohydrolase 2 [Hoeflea ulvae]|uniref:Quinoprotein relay system zinc metallohydrolase 2 n=1 Tax=Hoeflea ulvae TaxID=2983764 RepID=A0ABT3YKW8_9HYPH|nr:quinoprotein relay system zinc metallohydrolase 2 [Hoeflea ulvae]MCY0096483.1 quinoprotein relay system zinc metallohydrolase 2 [Hoeflea ulvae]
MFEAIIGLCLLSDPALCRDMLVPGYEAGTRAACERLLADSQSQSIPRPDPGPKVRFSSGEPRCAPAGPVASFGEVAPGVFVHRGMISDAATGNAGDVSNVGFVIGESVVAVIDSGGSRQVAESIYRAVRRQTSLPIGYVILTHMHPDHVLGASVFAEAGARVIGHAGLPRALQDRQEAYLANFGRLIGAAGFLGTEVVLPDSVVDQTAELDLGNRVLALQAWPDAHSGTDLTVGDPRTGILFAGDLLFDEHAPALDGSALGWRDVLARLQALPYQKIVPGHGGPLLDWPQAAAPLQDYLDVLIDDTRAAIARGDTLGQAAETVAQSQSDHWALFELFNPRNATVAYTELEWE